jgi:predicted phosphodiesterase
VSEPTKLRPEGEAMAFLSDVHGNLPALEAVLRELERRGVHRIYVAGDLLLGGDDPLGVWRALQKASAQCVRGLSDTALYSIDPTRLEALDPREAERLARFRKTREAVGQLVLEQLRRLPQSLRIPLLDGREILVVHGSPADATTEISHDMSDDEIASLLDDEVADVVVCGASHVPFQVDLGEVTVVNVGSVGEAPEGGVAHFTVVTPRMDGTEILQDYVAF